MSDRRQVCVERANSALAFREVRVVLKSGEVLEGLRNEPLCTSNELSVWQGFELKATSIPTDQIDSVMDVPQPQVPAHMYTEVCKSTGGLGKHLRWVVACPKNATHARSATVLVGNLDSDAQWHSLLALIERLVASLLGEGAVLRCKDLVLLLLQR